MRLNSRHNFASIAYGSDVPGNDGRRVTLVRGDNTVSDEDFAFLQKSPSFQKHAKAGMFVELPPEAPAPVVAPPEPAPDARARKSGESDKAYNARMRKLDDEEAGTPRA